MTSTARQSPFEKKFSQLLLAWYDKHGRHDLPWQQQRNLYRVWLSEIMLQQTQVSTVIPYFERFVKRFPDIATLARATQDEVLHLWTGLGYYARGRNLHKAAQIIADQYAGRFPENFDQVLALPGIGRSTAGAILAQASGQRHVILDGNVKRVLTRLYAIDGWPGQKKVEEQLWQLADKLTPKHELCNYTQAIMDLGATLCARKASCEDCPFTGNCQAFMQGKQQSYPTPRPRKALPVKATRMLIIKNPAGHILLQQRPPSGIWGSLWSLPESAENDSYQLAKWCQQQLGLELSSSHIQPVLRHTFSHFHLDITPVLCEINGPANHVLEAENRVWYNTRQPELLGMPAPVLKIIENISTATG